MNTKTEKDIFGVVALDYLKGNKDGTIQVEIDVAEDDTLPVAYLFRTYRTMPHIERLALRQSTGKVLDVGAGTGVHALYLQGKGLEVHAIDSSPGMVEVMKKRGVINALCSNFMDYQSGGFDTILLLMNGIGLAGTLKGLHPLLIHAKRLLKPGGKILLESTNIMYVFEQEDGSYLIPLNSNYFGETIMTLSYNDKKAKPVKWLYLDPETLAEVAQETGFEMEVLHGGPKNNYLVSLTLKY